MERTYAEAYDDSDLVSLLSASSPGEDETTEEFLVRVSALLTLAWDSTLGPQSYDFMRLYTSCDFSNQAGSVHDNPFPYSKNLEDHITALQALRKANPEWRTACFNFSASVHEKSGRAIVWFTSGASGNPSDISVSTTNRESVSKMYWRKKESGTNEWECYSHECIRGGGNAP